jgi:plasmid stability protein
MDDIIRSQFRLPRPLHLQLKATARANGRSLNAEAVAQLSRALSMPEDVIAQAKSAAPTASQLAEVLGRIPLRNILTAEEVDTIATRLQTLLASDS